ncbi:hypothetical protein AKJ09_07221 [Labilithrix luteola]|uniref:Uncharacterized protein n=1 Tax=Labilithrix luteola TaxID=1391654 RepID=A0A0K1Q480_9BACT|nr:hypothetical protein AKJ09_07221 [Labilithrix luteola]
MPNFRDEDIFRAIRRHIEESSGDDFRVIHFSVQETHIHLIVEATNQVLLSRGVQHLARRITWDVNRLRRHSGSLWRDRYTRRDLTNLRQVRNALVYVLMNARKHQCDEKEAFLASISLDPCSSAAWLDGWHPSAAWMLLALQLDLLRRDLHECPVAAPRTWALREGWKHYGLIHDDEAPSNRLSTRSQTSRSGHASVRARPLTGTRRAIDAGPSSDVTRGG